MQHPEPFGLPADDNAQRGEDALVNYAQKRRLDQTPEFWLKELLLDLRYAVARSKDPDLDFDRCAMRALDCVELESQDYEEDAKLEIQGATKDQPPSSPDDRASRGDQALLTFGNQGADTRDADLSDLLADLRHCVARSGDIDFDAVQLEVEAAFNAVAPTFDRAGALAVDMQTGITH